MSGPYKRKLVHYGISNSSEVLFVRELVIILTVGSFELHYLLRAAAPSTTLVQFAIIVVRIEFELNNCELHI